MFEGVVRDGVVILDSPASLPDGTRVRVTALGEQAAQAPTIWEKLTALGRRAEQRETELPADLAENHDHYLHGLPKRS